jgi:hypothetical protein
MIFESGEGKQRMVREVSSIEPRHINPGTLIAALTSLSKEGFVGDGDKIKVCLLYFFVAARISNSSHP